MAASNEVVINLATGLEDPERVVVAFLVGEAATRAGKQVVRSTSPGASPTPPSPAQPRLGSG